MPKLLALVVALLAIPVVVTVPASLIVWGFGTVKATAVRLPSEAAH